MGIIPPPSDSFLICRGLADRSGCLVELVALLRPEARPARSREVRGHGFQVEAARQIPGDAGRDRIVRVGHSQKVIQPQREAVPKARVG